jgi:hypothetical protein
MYINNFSLKLIQILEKSLLEIYIDIKYIILGLFIPGINNEW